MGRKKKERPSSHCLFPSHPSFRRGSASSRHYRERGKTKRSNEQNNSSPRAF